MDEMMTLVECVGTSASEVRNTLGEIGDMLDGVSVIYNNALNFGEAIGYKRRLLEEENNIYKKIAVAGTCFLVGAGITVSGIWLINKFRAKNKELNNDEIILNKKSEAVYEENIKVY